MTLFFLVVGLELKREILVGELSSIREALLPIVGALGGMVVPGLLYKLLNPSMPQAAGWGIPMATDIAFSIGILVMLAWRIPRSLIVFLTALAIADDLGAVLIIALFYSQDLNAGSMLWGAAAAAALIVLNQGGIRHSLPYALLGFVLWLALLHSGLHATIAGVILAFTIPARPAYALKHFKQRLSQLQQALDGEEEKPGSCRDTLECPDMASIAASLEETARAVQSPQQHMEHTLGPWVTFLVIPLFAFSNAAIDLRSLRMSSALAQPVTVGVIAGLVVGKFVGISLFSWSAVKFGLSKLPTGVGWPHLLGVSWLAGIGFTMSLFINQLAFADPVLLNQAKLGILVASLLAGVIGSVWLMATGRRP
jgi:NhaA family Na+:H+ antiporter